jgi:hypothetical protein
VRFIQNVLRSTLLHVNKTIKKCIQFLNKGQCRAKHDMTTAFEQVHIKNKAMQTMI